MIARPVRTPQRWPAGRHRFPHSVSYSRRFPCGHRLLSDLDFGTRKLSSVRHMGQERASDSVYPWVSRTCSQGLSRSMLWSSASLARRRTDWPRTLLIFVEVMG